ncbi:MAG: nicotinate (nicotinamide) nucleotide adenylyltransferase, partial [Lachnospiraceae bacterium]|nr:nicotinate (nicotinamide) nucleotide adenylyltransferase [Lachnospiraceae bacterium]
SKIPPHKQNQNITAENKRAAMIQLAIQNKPPFIYSDLELKREGFTYTADTLRILQEQNAEHVYYFILGGDSLAQLERWYHPEEIMRRVVILAISRYGMGQEKIRHQIDYLTRNYQARIQVVDMPRMDISSSEIRDRVRQGKPLEGWVSPAVETYIQDHCLYQ